ncbi:MAG: cell division FtsA domain-containing protein [Planctomycetota bacterium]
MVKRSAASSGGPIIDIGTTSLKLYDGPRAAELALERGVRGEITASSAARIREQLRGFFGPDRSLVATWCALPARGVSLRLIDVPPAPAEELDRLVKLQIERELPLPLEQLAWGFETAPLNGAPRSGLSRITVAVLRRDVLAEYQQLFTEWPGAVTFCVASMAIAALVDELHGRQCILDVGCGASELLCLDDGAGRELRVLPWGGDRVTRRIAEQTNLSVQDAETLKRDFSDGRDTPLLKEHRKQVAAIVAEELAIVAGHVSQSGILLAAARAQNGQAPSSTLYVTGGGARLKGLGEALGRALVGVKIVPLVEFASGGVSAVAAGLRARGTRPLAPCLRIDGSDATAADGGRPTRQRHNWWWGSAAALLVILALGVDRYFEALVSSTNTAALVENVESTLRDLPRYEQELAFRSELAKADLRALDVLAEVARLAPEGLLIKEFQINQRGTVQIVGQLASAELVNQLGRQLEESPWLSAVRVEAAPAQGGEGASFRILAQRGRDGFPARGAVSAPPAASIAPGAATPAAPAGKTKAADDGAKKDIAVKHASKKGASDKSKPSSAGVAGEGASSAVEADDTESGDVSEVFDTRSIRWSEANILRGEGTVDLEKLMEEVARKQGGNE